MIALIYLLMQEPTSVRAVAVEEVAFHPQSEVAGEVIAHWDSALGAEVSAVIESVLVDVADQVKAGTPLLRMDARVFELGVLQARAALQEAEAKRTLAQLQLDRAEKLIADAIISDDDYAQRRAELASTQAVVDMRRAQLQNAQLQLDKCEIKAPFDGFITQRWAQKGQWVQIGQPLFQIVDPHAAQVSVRLSESQRTSFITGTHHQFSCNGSAFSLSVDKVLPVFNAETRTAEARLKFVQKPAQPGQTGTVTWQSSELMVPAALLVSRGDHLGLMVVDGDKARFVHLKGAVEGRPAAVELALNTLIIDEGRLGLRDGDPIRLK